MILEIQFKSGSKVYCASESFSSALGICQNTACSKGCNIERITKLSGGSSIPENVNQKEILRLYKVSFKGSLEFSIKYVIANNIRQVTDYIEKQNPVELIEIEHVSSDYCPLLINFQNIHI